MNATYMQIKNKNTHNKINIVTKSNEILDLISPRRSEN